MKPILLTVLLFVFAPLLVSAQDTDTRYYNMGTPVLTQIWVDPVHGNDANAGDTLPTAIRTLVEAWNRVPRGTALTTGYQFNLVAGDYAENTIPVYWELRYGTYEHPIMFVNVGQPVTLHAPINMFDSRYVYFIGLDITPGVDAFHCERCDHILLRRMTITGANPDTYQTQETVKINQSTYIYIEGSNISGAWDNAIDFVAVQYGHVIGNAIHNAGDWCAYAKGGSAYLLYEANTIYDCGTGGFTAGQGTGFQFMEPPFLRYEAYYIRFVNNLVHDIAGAGVGVQGGYNVLIAYNTFRNSGSRSHLFEAVFGGRSCDGQPGDEGRQRCDEYAAQGGWGNSLIGDGENYVRIPNRHVYVYNNVFYNPDVQSRWQQFTLFGAYSGSAQGNAPSPAHADDDLRIVNNVIWNGPADHPLGLGEQSGCAAGNPTCNETQLRGENAINTLSGATSGPVPNYPPISLPPFLADDDHVPAPQELSNFVTLDMTGAERTGQDSVGAVIAPIPPTSVPPVTLVAPADGSSAGGLRPMFVWNALSGAVNYELWLTLGATPATKVYTGTLTRYTPPADLVAGLDYAWQVYALFPGGVTSPVSSTFTVFILSPTDAAPQTAFFQTDTVTLSWSRVADATDYEVQVSTSPAFTTLAYPAATTPSLSHSTLSLTNGLYYWRVRAVSGAAVGAWSVAQSFVVFVP